jgi:hypothetical protein
MMISYRIIHILYIYIVINYLILDILSHSIKMLNVFSYHGQIYNNKDSSEHMRDFLKIAAELGRGGGAEG